MNAWRAVVLAGGKGRRLWPLTAWCCKPLVRIHSIPLIVYSLAALKRAGIRDILITVHHKARRIVHHLRDGNWSGMQLQYVFEPMPLGTGGVLKYLQPFLQGHRSIVLNSDTILDLDLKHLMHWHEERGALATMVVRSMPSVGHFSPVIVGNNARILAIRNPPSKTYPEEKIKMFAGAQVLMDAIFEYLPEGRSDIVSAFWQPALADGLDLLGYEYTGPWWEVGTFRQLLSATRESRLSDFPALGHILESAEA